VPGLVARDSAGSATSTPSPSRVIRLSMLFVSYLTLTVVLALALARLAGRLGLPTLLGMLLAGALVGALPESRTALGDVSSPLRLAVLSGATSS